MRNAFGMPMGAARAGALALLTLASMNPVEVRAKESCDISSDTVRYYQRLDQAIVLLQYHDVVLRAVDGKIRCAEDAENARQKCQIDGPGEMLIASDRGQFQVTTTAEKMHEIHVYAGGDLTCGLSSDFE